MTTERSSIDRSALRPRAGPPPLRHARKRHAEPVERTRERVRFHVPERVVRLLEDRPLAGSRHDQVGFDLRQPAQALEQPDTVDHAGRAGDRHDQPLHSRNRRRRTSSRVFWYITSHSRLPSGAGRAYEESVRRTSVSIVSSSLASSESARMTSVRSSSGALTVTASVPPSSLTIMSARYKV